MLQSQHSIPEGTGAPAAQAPRGVIPVCVALIVFACFAPVLSNGFVNWDDDANFLENPNYRGLSPAHLRWMFTTFHMGHYQPLTWMTLGLDYDLWEMNAGGYHFTSLVLHIATGILFYLFLCAFLERVRPRDGDSIRRDVRWPAALGALFFAIHPLRVESVAWATERKDVLCGFFFMLTLLAYLRMVGDQERGRTGRLWLVLSVLAFSCSLFSKALGLMLPVVLFVLDVYPLRRFVPGRRSQVLIEKIPFLVASLVEGSLAYLAIREAGLVRTMHDTLHPARWGEAAFGLSFYLWKTMLPVRLSPLYLAPRVLDPWTLIYGISALSVLLGTTVLVLLRRRVPALLAAWVCYATLLLPVLRLNFDAPQVTADRYSYLSCLPWVVLAAHLLNRATGGPRGGPGWGRRATFAIAGGLLLILGTLTFQQSRVWRDPLSLWDHALSIDPSNTLAYNNRGTARAALNDRNGALEDFDRALQLDPEMAEALYNRGSLRTDLGDFKGAIRDETEAIRICAADGRAWHGRGRARQAMGDEAGARADFAEAYRIQTSLLRAAGLDAEGGTAARERASEEVRTLNSEGNGRASKGDWEGAIDRYSEALRIDPGVAALYNNRGNARAAKGDQRGAVADYSDALRIDPNFGEAYANRGMSRALLGDLTGAVADYSSALKIDPRDPAVYANRGMALATLGDRLGAAEDFKHSLSCAPEEWPRRAVVQGLLARVRGQ